MLVDKKAGVLIEKLLFVLSVDCTGDTVHNRVYLLVSDKQAIHTIIFVQCLVNVPTVSQRCLPLV